jgi:hypothetical protein
VTNSAGTNYGNEITFTTLAVAPTLVTKPITSITSTSATSGGIINTDGGSVITERGLVYGTNTNPTILSNKLVGSSVGTDWSSTITGLIGNTKYYVRAFATNAMGTSYGNLDSLVTLPIVPTLTTSNIISITDSSAISGGNISSNGGAAITDRGIVWGISQNPTLPSTDTTKNGTGTGLFTSNLRGLNGSTTYYVRAYATNAAGTSYGGQVSFQTTGLAVGDLYQGGYVLSLSTPTTGTIVSLADLGLFTAAGAVTACDNYVNTDTGTGVYSDWYLAEIGAIQTMYTNRALLGTFNTTLGDNGSQYRSNTSFDAFKRGVSFYDGALSSLFANTAYSVRAFRNF